MNNRQFKIDTDGGQDVSLWAKIIRKLVTNRADRKNKKSMDVVISWFPPDKQSDVRQAIPRMVRDSDVPVDEANGGIYFEDFDEAQEYQTNHGVDDWQL